MGWSGLATAGLFATAGCGHLNLSRKNKPNVVFVFADQWRAQATGYNGDPNLQGMTPVLDKMEKESINLVNAVSTCPVCTPYRASLITGQYPLTNGLFLNDLCLNPKAVSMAKIFTEAGYDTGYIGKWNLDGHGRSAYIPKERRQGFEYWKVLECTHNYNRSFYYDNDNQSDPYQQNNLIGNPQYADLQRALDERLSAALKERHDTFERGEVYIRERGYKVTTRGTVDYQQHDS
jgi:arylsulfatase A-like enzyme